MAEGKKPNKTGRGKVVDHDQKKRSAKGRRSKFSEYRVFQLLLALPSLASSVGSDREAIVDDVIDSLEKLNPTDEIERMLACQMIACNHALMDCLGRAANPENSFLPRQENLKQAHKLMSLSIRQIQALDKHRGRGQQKVTVEHVHVNEGGQAHDAAPAHASERPARLRQPTVRSGAECMVVPRGPARQWETKMLLRLAITRERPLRNVMKSKP